MRKQRDVRVRAIVKMERTFCIIFPNVVIDENSEMGLEATGAEKLEDKTLVGVKLGVAMPVDQLNGRCPGVEHADPFRFGLDGFPCVGLLLFKEDITPREVLRVVVVIEPGADGGMYLLKIDVLVGENVAPDRFRKRVIQPSKLEVRDRSIRDLLFRERLPDFKGLGEMLIRPDGLGNVLEVGYHGQDRLGESMVLLVTSKGSEEVDGVPPV